MFSSSRLISTAFALVLPYSAHSATVVFNGDQEGGTEFQNQTAFLIDLGVVLSGEVTGFNRLLFEAGGDGDGIGIFLIDNDLRVYHDNSVSSNLAEDTTYAVNISSFFGKVVSIRLLADLSQGTGADTARLDVFDGTSTLSSGTVLLTGDATSAAGADGWGAGGKGGGSVTGIAETSASTPPDMDQFNGSDYVISSPATGARVLNDQQLTGKFYTGSDVTAAPGIQDPATWGLVPEPSAPVLLGFGMGLMVLRRRRP